MATITEDYVSFETAKLLKEKGFKVDDETCRRWAVNKQLYEEEGHFNESNAAGDYIPIPTIQMAMKWLREVHGLYINILPNPLDFKHEDIQDGWGCEVTHLSNLAYDDNYEFFQKKYNSYEEACEAAIKYCLENLI